MTTEKKAKLRKVIFILSFLPYAGILLYGMYGAICGIGGFFSTSYGADGFFWGVLGASFVMTVVPVLPASLIYHTVCLIKLMGRKVGISEKRRRTAAKWTAIVLGAAALYVSIRIVIMLAS